MSLKTFDGPLDLLLYVIEKNEVNIHDIAIAEITNQYLEYLEFMRMLDIDVAGEELRITLAPLSSPHRTLAARALCKPLNETATVFPGTKLRMRFTVPPPR